MLNLFSLQHFANVVAAITPSDLSSAALSGPYASLKHCEALTIIIIKSIGTAGDDPVITLTQAQDAAGTGAKALNITSLKHQTGADITTSTSFTDGLDGSGNVIDRQYPVSSYDTDGIAGAESEQLILIRVHEDDLDEGFTHVKLNIADVGTNAQLGAAIYIASGLAHSGINKPAWNA